jgi:O-antigen/teichoic acid export membrane protein
MDAVAQKQAASIRLQTFSMIAGKISALLATFAVPLVLTRLLSKSEYGIYAQFYVLVFFCTGFFSLAMQSNLYFFYPTENSQNRKSLVLHTLIFLILATLLTVGLVSFPGVGRYLIGEGELSQYKIYIATGIILLMPVIIIEALYVVKKDIITSLLYPPAEVLLRLSLVIGLVIIKPGLNSVFNGVIISAAACLVFVLIYSMKEIGIRNLNKSTINLDLAKKQLIYSIPFGIAVSLNILFQRLDKIICISFLTPSDYAIYAVSFYGIPGIMQIYDSLAQVYLIQMTVKHQENKTSEIRGIYKSLVTKTFSFSFPAFLIVMLYARKIIVLLFTKNYIDAVPLFRAYLFSILIFMLGSGLILRATGKTNYTLRSYLISGAITIPLTYFLIKNFGTWGAMTGALTSISLPRLLNLATEIKLLKANFRSFFPWKELGLIGLISSASIVPFIALEYYFKYGILTTALLGIFYLLAVALFELKYNLFPIESAVIRDRFASQIENVRSIYSKRIINRN